MNYKFNSNTIIRIPLLPLKVSFSKSEIQTLFSQKEVKEALFLSTPDLLTEFNKWENSGFKTFEKEGKLVTSLLKYAKRMHARCTPFGLFAGCNVIHGIPNSIVTHKTEVKRSTRLDMNFSGELAMRLAKNPNIKKNLKYYPNTSIYSVNGQLRYVEYLFRNKKRNYQVSGIGESPYLNLILERSKAGLKYDELLTLLVSDEITKEEASLFIDQLIEYQLLVSELEPEVSGKELLDKIIEITKKIQTQKPNHELSSVIDVLESVKEDLIKCDKNLGNNTSLYDEIAERLEVFNIPIAMNRLFQTDWFPNYHDQNLGENEFGSDIIHQQLKEAISVLNVLTTSQTKGAITEFVKKFNGKYEGQEVPLLKVLDAESGIGYWKNTNRTGDVCPLVSGVRLPASGGGSREIQWNEIQSFLFKKLRFAQKNSEKVIQISSKDFKGIAPNWKDLPNSMSIMFNHLGLKNDMPYLNLKGISGPSAVNLLGRFAQSNEMMKSVIMDISKNEQSLSNDVVLAEIIHLPENRTGNILLRPSFREYEIPYLTASSVAVENQITLDDLYVSVKNNHVVLKSKRLGKLVQPMLGNAHNYSSKSLPVYHFLCDLQSQNMRGGLFFNWGPLSGEFDYLPRVEIGNVVVSRGTWNINKEKIKEICQGDGEILERASKWTEKWELPKLVLLIEGDNELLVNLEDALSIRMFIDSIKKKQRIVLKEFLFDNETSIIRDEAGNGFTNEFVSILQKEIKNEVPKTHKSFGVSESSSIQRDFSLGSEWLYYKLYCGVKTADKLLAQVIKPFTEELLKKKIIDSWFFIRYSDPELHIRVRFHVKEPGKLGDVLEGFYEVTKSYRESGLIWRYEADTYKREIERYGSTTMSLSEKLFFNNSQSVVDLLDLIDGDAGDEIRWKYAFKAVDGFLSSFHYSDQKKMAIMDNLKTGFGKEFGMNKSLKLQMDQRFRALRKDISNIIDGKVDEDLILIFKLVERQLVRDTSFVLEVLNLDQAGVLEVQLNDFIASHIHMLLNRTFRNKQRLHELFIYDFLWRTYRSSIAQKKHRLKAELV